jgi:hypothetical protein
MWTEQLATLQRRARVYDATLKALDTAERATMRTATRYLERRMVADLERVTAGRYRRVKVDDENLALRVYAPERGDWVDVASLSQGTLDTVYLAARIGLVRLVTGDRRPPLVMDDPFVTLDDERATRALELLKDISKDFQVIYLTTSDRYDEAADKVQVLEPATAVTPDLEPGEDQAEDGAGPVGDRWVIDEPAQPNGHAGLNGHPGANGHAGANGHPGGPLEKLTPAEPGSTAAPGTEAVPEDGEPAEPAPA